MRNLFDISFPWFSCEQANPLELRARTKRLQDELPLLREECDKLLAAKQVITVTTEYVCVYLLLVVLHIPNVVLSEKFQPSVS